jgi:UDP-GlcNAc:undecaprenyl-phosphate GlcNAc-1-phosphate transferase
VNTSLWVLATLWILSAGAAAIVAPLVIRLYRHMGWVDDPARNLQPKTVHTKPTPRGGGLVVAAGLATGAAFLWPWSPEITGVLAGALILLVSGTLDDRYDIHPLIRWILNILAAICVILGGVGIDYITNPFADGILNLRMWPIEFPLLGISFSPVADGLALIWIVWNMNAVNWSKGVDGQLPGFVSIAAFVIALLSLRFAGDTTQWPVTVLALSLSGAYAGFLLWNRYPQHMMPGYAAGSLAGYFLAVLAILSGAKLATVLLLLAIPTADAVFAVTRRLAAGKSPFWGDRGHLHHRMLDSGWSIPRIARFYWGTTFIFGLLALSLRSEGKRYAIMAAVLVFMALLVWLQRSISSSKPSAHVSGSKT